MHFVRARSRAPPAGWEGMSAGSPEKFKQKTVLFPLDRRGGR